MDEIKRKFIEIAKSLEGDWYGTPDEIAEAAWQKFEPALDDYVDDQMWHATIGSE